MKDVTVFFTGIYQMTDFNKKIDTSLKAANASIIATKSHMNGLNANYTNLINNATYLHILKMSFWTLEENTIHIISPNSKNLHQLSITFSYLKQIKKFHLFLIKTTVLNRQ